MTTKKILIYFGIFVGLIIVLAVVNQLKPDTVYGKPESELFSATKTLLKDPNYNNIIIPEQLDKKIADKQSFFVYYFAADCHYCKFTTPLLKPAADELGINLHQFNLLEFRPYFNKMNIESTPTLVYYKDGVEIDRMVGGIKESETSFGFSIDDFNNFFNKYKPEGND